MYNFSVTAMKETFCLVSTCQPWRCYLIVFVFVWVFLYSLCTHTFWWKFLVWVLSCDLNWAAHVWWWSVVWKQVGFLFVCMWWDYCNCVLNVRLFNLQNPCSKVGHFEDFSLKFRQWKKRLIQCGCGFTFNTSVKHISQYQKLINQFWEILRPLKKYFKSNFLKDFLLVFKLFSNSSIVKWQKNEELRQPLVTKSIFT